MENSKIKNGDDRMCYFTLKKSSYDDSKLYVFFVHFKGVVNPDKVFDVTIFGNEYKGNIDISLSFSYWYHRLSVEEKEELKNYICKVIKINESDYIFANFYQQICIKLNFCQKLMELPNKLKNIGFVATSESEIDFVCGDIDISAFRSFDSYDSEHIVVKIKNEKLFDFYLDLYNYEERIVTFFNIVNLIKLSK